MNKDSQTIIEAAENLREAWHNAIAPFGKAGVTAIEAVAALRRAFPPQTNEVVPCDKPEGRGDEVVGI